jgi:parvulin-like peptidyl-prolyl isomerase
MKLTVNGEVSPPGALESEINGLMGRFRRLSEEEAKNFGFTTPESIQERAVEWGRENIVERMLLRQEALKDSEPVPEEVIQKSVDAAIERMGGKEKFGEAGFTEEEAQRDAEAEAKVERLIATLTANIKPAKSKEIAEFYRKRRDQFRVPESINAAHILKNVNEEQSKEVARKAIEEAKAEIDGGADFFEVAGRVSDAPTNDGNLGWFPPGRMVLRFDEAAFALQPGQVSEIFRTSFGYHIVKVLDRRSENAPPLAEVSDLIAREIVQQRQNEILEAFVDKLRETATVEFDATEN